MSTPELSGKVRVDVTNPGQFFACCGLLELAARLNACAVGYFENGSFMVSGDVHRVLDQLFQCDVTVDFSVPSDSEEGDEFNSDPDGDLRRGRTYPMTLREPFNMRLDWWTDVEAQRQKLKTWTAGQHVTDLLLGYHKGKNKPKYIPSMREHFAEVVKQFPHDWLREPLPIEVPMSFSYDSRLSRNNALDLGHVANNTMAFSPAVDVLTLIGLQRFRPLTLETWSRNLYYTWNQPLSVEIAAVAAIGLIPQLIDCCFDFPIKRRDAQGRFKLFGPAQPSRRPNV